ncbi:MAG TPA: response regulator [Opitutaceae bacterium]|nr:response regulator [Opitutaceae bacterium]
MYILIDFLGAFANLPAAAVVNPTPSNCVVLVDDEASYTNLMSQMLGDNLDCRIVTFTRPLEALRSLRDLNPAVIVTDYFMPQVNGLEFIRRAAPLVPAAAFVLITGHNLSDAEDALARLTALKGFLAKPFGWRRLADEIVRVWPAPTRPPVQRAEASS